MGTQNLCFFYQNKKKIMYTPINPSFTILKWGLKGSKHAFVMKNVYC